MEETYVSTPLPTGGTQTGEGTRSISGKKTRTGHKEHNFWLQATPEPYKRLDLLSQLRPLLKPPSGNQHLIRLLNSSFQFFQYTQYTSQCWICMSLSPSPHRAIPLPSTWLSQGNHTSPSQQKTTQLMGQSLTMSYSQPLQT